ncbi:MAG: energy transducer TonB, partial [Stenotrophobium sp.]
IPEPPAPPPSPSPAPASKSSTTGNYLIIKQQFKPIYPRRALRDGIQGTVTLLIHVNENGVPIKVEVVKSSGNFDLDNAARNAAMKSLFVPQMQNGVAVKAQGLQDIVFKLDEG